MEGTGFWHTGRSRIIRYQDKKGQSIIFSKEGVLNSDDAFLKSPGPTQNEYQTTRHDS